MTELAVCLPLLIFVVFGSIQACNLIYLKHGLTTAAYEATLELAKRSATNSTVTTRAQQVLDARGIKSGTVQLLPAGTDILSILQGEPLTIEVTAPVSSNITFSGFFPMPRDVTARLVGTR